MRCRGCKRMRRCRRYPRAETSCRTHGRAQPPLSLRRCAGRRAATRDDGFDRDQFRGRVAAELAALNHAPARLSPHPHRCPAARKRPESSRITHHCASSHRHRRAIDRIISRTRRPPTHSAQPHRA
ncbi:hypothetical protein BCPG_03072 [Burkholderia cenocepacia PC184]|nr:hypothetical protein BCPG_03072 [Burkholderia cenocepacia PC184]